MNAFRGLQRIVSKCGVFSKREVSSQILHLLGRYVMRATKSVGNVVLAPVVLLGATLAWTGTVSARSSLHNLWSVSDWLLR